MHSRTRKALGDATATQRQMREVQGFQSFSCYNDLVLANTLGKHKVSRRWTWHSPNGGYMYHNQIDYIMVRRHFVTNVFLTPVRQEASQELT